MTKIPKKNLKSATQKLLIFFKGFSWNNICSFFYLKAKNEEKLKKVHYFLGQKTVSTIKKNIYNNEQFIILHFLFDICSLM